MEGKIALYNADGAQIGETFIRRARQLVKQQRATWVDDNHTAIRFNLDIEDVSVPYPVSDKPPERNHLYELAEIRLNSKRKVIIQLLLFIPIVIAIAFLSLIIYHGYGEPAGFWFFGFANGAYLTFTACNLFSYYKQHIKGQLYAYNALTYLKNRREAQLEAEVEKMRRMGYSE